MHIEVDVPAGTAEVAFEAESEQGISDLALYDSAGEPIMEVRVAAGSQLEWKEITLEAEGSSIGELFSTHPAGPYLVRGATVHGNDLSGVVVLSHDFPGRFHVVRPPDAGVLRRREATLTWCPSVGAARYMLEIERETGEFCLEVVLPPNCTSFTVPPEVLAAGNVYDYSLVAEGDTDNQIEVEGSFLVAE